MARKTTTVKQVELTRALRAARNAGLEVARVEVDTAAGKIVIITGAAGDQRPDNAFDAWVASNARPS